MQDGTDMKIVPKKKISCVKVKPAIELNEFGSARAKSVLFGISSYFELCVLTMHSILAFNAG